VCKYLCISLTNIASNRALHIEMILVLESYIWIASEDSWNESSVYHTQFVEFESDTLNKYDLLIRFAFLLIRMFHRPSLSDSL
jgi:hypothetical protein